MPFIVIYDSCVLFPRTMRDILTRVAAAGLVRARWTEHIHDELRGRLVDKYPDMAEGEQINKLIAFLMDTVPDCLVHGYEDLIEAFTLPDANDRHVAAAAVKAGAQMIVTRDGRGFSKSFLDRHDLTLRDPDDFVADLIDLPRVGPLMHQIVTEMADDQNKTVSQVIDALRKNKMPLTAAKLGR
ncbi:PIN domain-containing protein [Gordonia alkanivorans]|uniref:PIN domain-containing protein n=1 Tax=Gordonia alkanivorans TaxID=84096 RepID=UPI00244B1819|nr:PIN domain-containing protein [Gordonia alkanivorans]MDH3007100.1 PIN domain-containing protein [Gordonia alkanivorans]MDH3015026.1 PIN domain-containing protein [Gordonia alkanivorans]MDH3021613.1 PIN domain-containing protein [Gordonia alkanivorans]MDH3040164.1 PIN domain-containing protein [Gordonia alkanivorans]MDH3059422.1 PIN domain-containing protein [Gordonia alkanivorans]